ncbi:MAG: hypothetical protein ACM3QY_03810 [Candidatus Levyibacteriota bacterium]
MPSHFKQAIASIALCTACALPGPARAADYTDLWWVPQESGWGANVIQSDAFIYVTFFIYGVDRSPTWYSAQLTWDGTRYSGNLYATQGTYWAAPWNPADHPAAQAVGTASFQPSAADAYHATLAYTVPGVGSFSKNIEREPLTLILLGGNYQGTQAGTYANCSDPSIDGPYTDNYTLAVSQTATSATLEFTYASGATCTISGETVQHGQLYDMPNASYVCSGTLSYTTTATVYEMKATALGLEGRLSATVGSGCRENANFAGVLL